MSDIFNQFQQQIYQQKILIAFSGGLDSTALLALCKKLQENRPHFQFRAIHIHHGLSPNADKWALHCENICRQFSIPLIVEKVRVDKSNGIEAGAREARYHAIANHLNIDEVLATAHHLNDQTETFLLALKRGSGVQGLSAMQKESVVFNLPIFRPLLQFTRAQLEDYVKSQKINWIEDESNEDNSYDRNFLRNIILPKMKTRWAHFDQAVYRAAQHCFEQTQLVNELLEDEFQKIFEKNDRTLSVKLFDRYSYIKQKALLRLWLARLQLAMPSQKQLEQLIRDVIFAKPDAIPQFKLANQVIRRYRQKLYLTADFADLTTVAIPLKISQTVPLPDGLGHISLREQSGCFVFSWRHYQVQLPPCKQPIEIRFAYSGKVKLHKNGVNQDIKKVWQNLNVPPWLRNRTPLIFYGDQLKSAVGFFKVFDC
ncbi:tRNA lysidine(34) synthetase TilS [Basfia succiniciproducens]|uniref:tRNA lysidine(34) synthetase TilS n=1 Tax=Basfia succiniciproducens TaxID=653940 RepID=UPI003FCEB7BA